uniref:Uncharacterized protein n=4 Tax=Clytia hemisphaerica TaxID=252671 RepID=A0A7M5V9G0_9CNID
DKDFVHVTIIGTTSGPIIRCSCSLYGLLNSTLNEEEISGPVEFEGMNCCHCRFAKDILKIKPMMFVPNENDETSIERNYFNEELISKAESYIKKPIVQLPSKSNVFKFSVVTKENEAELITIYRNKKKKRKVITCHNSFCQSKPSRERYLETFQTSEKLCPHLEFLRSSFDVNTLKFADEIDDDDEEDSEDIDFGMDMEYDNLETENDPSEWEKVFDEENGQWKFHDKAPSQLRVNDSRDEIYRDNIKKRAIQILLGQEIKLIPSKDGNCGCEVNSISIRY